MKEKKSSASFEGFLAGSASLRSNRASCSCHVDEVDEKPFRTASILCAPVAGVEGAGSAKGLSLTGATRGAAALAACSFIRFCHLALAASRNLRRASADIFLPMNLFERI